MGREDLLVTPANADAVAWLDRWPDWPGPLLVIVGPAACGKSHLASVWRERTQATPFAAADLDALPSGSGWASEAAVVVEDVDRAPPGLGLFHLFRRLAEAGGWLLLTARTGPADWGVTLPDLRSRLLAATSVAVRAPDDRLLHALLGKLFHDRQLVVGDEVLSYLLPRMERSFGAAAAIVARLDAAALGEGRAVTVGLARRVLAEVQAALGA
ncbi:MAG: DNA replication protein [Alphaproteobacteria bacterium]|nr:DNA replication protein [Alphaproteobacteria bacterium]